MSSHRAPRKTAGTDVWTDGRLTRRGLRSDGSVCERETEEFQRERHCALGPQASLDGLT